MKSKAIKNKRNFSKDKRCQKVWDDKENFNTLTYKKHLLDENDIVTTKVNKKIFKRIENENTPEIKKDIGKNFHQETEKIRRQFNNIEKLNRKENKIELEEKSSTTYTDGEKSDISTCPKLEKELDNSRKQISEKRLEDFFIKRQLQHNFPEENYYVIDQWYLYQEFLHPLISPEKNNDIEKNKLIHRHLKKSTTQNYKTDSCSAFQYLLNEKGKRNFSEFNMSNEEKNPTNKINNKVDFSKKRKISSCKKVYESDLIFYDQNNHSHYFKVYNDNDTGFDNRYNQILKIMEMDNDVDTDDEQLYLAKNFTLDSLKDTLNNFNTKQLKNKIRFKRSRTINPRRRTKI